MRQSEPLPIYSTFDDQTLMREVVAYYHQTLKQTDEARDYLAKRGILSDEAIETFHLGYANRTLCTKITPRHKVEGQALRERLVDLGFFRKATGHEHLNGALLFPIREPDGTITQIYGRKINPGFKGKIKHLYLPGSHRSVWNPDCLAEKDVILCESLIDALTFWVHGFRNVTTAYGVQGFHPFHIEAFLAGHVKRVLIAYDSDEAGDKGAAKVSSMLLEAGIATYRVKLPCKDINDFASRESNPPAALDMLLDNAVWLNEGEESLEIYGRHRRPKTTPIAEQSMAAPDEGDPGPSPADGSGLDVQQDGEDLFITIKDRVYRIRGLERNMGKDQLQVKVLVKRGDHFHADALEFYSDYHRSRFSKRTAQELQLPHDTIRKDIGKVFFTLEARMRMLTEAAMTPAKDEVELTQEEANQALDLLTSPQLAQRILDDFDQLGLVGESSNKLLGYCAAVSRKLNRPLAVIIQSSSAAGKTTLMESILAMMPEEEVIKYSAMTGQSLFYMGGKDLKHKIMAVVEEKGAERASYSLKLLQSEGELTIASTGKDPKTGQMETREYRVEGPVMILLTTTAIDMDEELLNRCLVLSVNEGRHQTQAIHQIQREAETVEGFLAHRKAESLKQLHRNAQRLLKPIRVFNPYARYLTFLNDKTRMRRDHKMYLSLIQAVTLLHQYQRPIKVLEADGLCEPYIESTLEDIELANRLAHETLGRTLDELSPQTRQMLLHLEDLVRHLAEGEGIEASEVRFTRRDVRRHCGWTDYQVRSHMKKLMDLEYVITHRGTRGQTFVYELVYRGEGTNGEPFLLGLIDVAHLKQRYDTKNEHPSHEFEHEPEDMEHDDTPQRALIEHPSSMGRARLQPQLTSKAATI
ncbi:MAG: toprim domain-containing protein [Acidobacteria bacterium]|nr:toprim domain-containing protein [Acidobacteriota bacterium]